MVCTEQEAARVGLLHRLGCFVARSLSSTVSHSNNSNSSSSNNKNNNNIRWHVMRSTGLGHHARDDPLHNTPEHSGFILPCPTCLAGGIHACAGSTPLCHRCISSSFNNWESPPLYTLADSIPSHEAHFPCFLMKMHSLTHPQKLTGQLIVVCALCNACGFVLI